MNNAVWRFTNNSTALSNSALGDLAANQAIDVPATSVAVGWSASGGAGSSVDRFYIQNQFTHIHGVPDAGADAEIIGVGSGGNQVARAQFIERGGFGQILFDQSA